jgi:hypothetical protein
MQIEFSIIANQKKITESSFLNFLDKGMKGVLKLTKFDYKEPLKRTLELNNLKEPLELFNYYSNIIFKGKNKSSISIQSTREGLFFLLGHVDLKEKDLISNTSDLIILLEIFSENSQILFGNICTEDEYDFKHKVVKEYSYGWKGVSIMDFMNLLPGVYWYTIFGKELVEAVGVEKFKNIPNVIYTEPKNGCIAFHLDEPIDAVDYESRIKLENKIAKKIGENYFFDKEKKEGEYSHPKKFKDYLNSLQQ